MSFQGLLQSRRVKFTVDDDTVSHRPSDLIAIEKSSVQLSNAAHFEVIESSSETRDSRSTWKDVSKETFDRFTHFAYTGDYSPEGRSTILKKEIPPYPENSMPRRRSEQTRSTAIRDHTTDTLGPDGDEYIPRDYDEAGERKITPTGQLSGRKYEFRTFTLPERGDKLFMLATECTRGLGYRDSYLLFNKNRSLYKIIATQAEKEELIRQEILPFSYRSRIIAIVTAKSMFRQFGSRIIENGRRVRDDYWEERARKQGFTEEDLAGAKRPGSAGFFEIPRASGELKMIDTPGFDRVDGDRKELDRLPDMALGQKNIQWQTDNLVTHQKSVSNDSPRRAGKASNKFTVEQRGIKVLVYNRKESAFGDTRAGQNVISERRRQELGLYLRPDPTSFPMGNSKRIFSPGTVEFPLAFEDDPTNIVTIVAHVVHTFAYDLLLGNPFLQATKCLTTFKHRFVRCLFSITNMWSFNLLGETTHRFQGQLGKGLPFLGLPDIGSTRNVMDARWAKEKGRAAGFKILSHPENCGWILFPDGSEEPTIGQAHTTMTLSDGKVVPIVFELLPNCHIPVVLGQDFIFDHDIYTRYSKSILELNDLDNGDELMPMHFRRHKSEAKSGAGAGLPTARQKDDLEQHLDWDLKHEYGRTASVEEWNLEYERRERYERSRNPNWQPDARIPLIEQKPKSPLLPSGENNRPEEGSDISSSFPSGDSTLTDSSTSSPDNTSEDPACRWDHDPYLSDSLVSEEAAQWQAERPS